MRFDLVTEHRAGAPLQLWSRFRKNVHRLDVDLLVSRSCKITQDPGATHDFIINKDTQGVPVYYTVQVEWLYSPSDFEKKMST